MTHGRKVCNILKEIRREIADKNEIEYTTAYCHFEGECQGTCPKCESEVKYLETELNKRKLLGKAVAVAGISLGVAGTFSACNTPQQPNTPVSAEQEITVEKVNVADTTEELIYQTMGFTPPQIIVLEGDIKIEEPPLINITVDTNQKFPPPLMGVAPRLDPFGEDENAELLEYQKKIDEEANKIYEYTEVEVLPSFPEGEKELWKFLETNLVFPRIEASFEGRVLVRFIVEKDGTISDITVQKSSAKVLSDEAIRVIKLMPKWKPAQKDGKPVRTFFTLPIEINLK